MMRDPLKTNRAVLKWYRSVVGSLPFLLETHDYENLLDYHEPEEFYKTLMTVIVGIQGVQGWVLDPGLETLILSYRTMSERLRK